MPVEWNASVPPPGIDGVLWDRISRLAYSIPDRAIIKNVTLAIGSQRVDIGRQRRVPQTVQVVNRGSTDSHFRVTSFDQNFATISSSAATTVDLVVHL